MPDYIVSSTEPPTICLLGTTSTVPEQFGADVLWYSERLCGFVGVQRKEFSDLLSSAGDGRLGKEITQLGNEKIAMAFLVVEGEGHWTPEGILLSNFARWDRRAYRSLLRSIQYAGIIVEHTDNAADTVAHIEAIAAWCEKGDHNSLSRRPKPKPKASDWGRLTDRAFASHMLQSIPMIGPKQADAILDYLNGRPFANLTLTEEELASIKGLGPKKVEAIMKAFSEKEK